MIALLLAILAAPLLALAILWAWSHTVIGRQPQTVPEAAVRVLWYLARWLMALARGLEEGGLAYRELIATWANVYRLEDQRKAYEAAHPKPKPEPEEPPAPVARRPYWWWFTGRQA